MNTDWRYWHDKWKDERIHSKALENEQARLRTRVAELAEALDIARICLKNRDRSELEEKAYFGICAVLAAKDEA